MSERKHHSIFKKIAVISEILKGDKSQGEIAIEYNLSPSLVSKWKYQMLKRKTDQPLISILYQQFGQLAQIEQLNREQKHPRK